VPSSGRLRTVTFEDLVSRYQEPLAMQANGAESAVPVSIYPQGFDFTDFLIFDPSSNEWISGSVYTLSRALSLALSGAQSDDPEPPGGGGGSGGDGTDTTPDMGFYLVVRNGPHLWAITNDTTLSGVVTIPVEAGNDVGTMNALSVREDGAAIGNSASIAPFQLPLHVVLDTTAMSNGVHQIYASAEWNIGGDEGSDGWLQADSPPVTINVYNEITFPSWIPLFGELYDSLLITAQSTHTNADWYVDVYGSDSGYIGTFSGHTDDGNIYGSWDLVGPHGESHANESFFDLVVTTVFATPGGGPSGSASASAPRTYKQTDNWTTHGMWVVANQQAWESVVGHEDLDTATDGFVTIAQGAGLTVRPTASGGNAFRIGYGDGIPESTRNSQWTALRTALYHQESRNFFWFGHGSDNQIGASASTNLMIPAPEIAAMLHSIPAGQTNRHGYRFVFLYGCETANGTLPESF
jgi:hypothetical protein